MPPAPPETSASAVLPLEDLPSRGPVTWRSITLGLTGIFVICGLTAYNDYVVNNTFMVGNYLPAGLLLLFVVFSLLINAPLRAIAPRHALSTAEISVAFAMALIACSLPSSGLMRYLPGNLVMMYHMPGQNPDYLDLLNKLNLPDWAFPSTTATDLAKKSNDPVIRDFVNRIPQQPDTFLERLWQVPWGAWLKPTAFWGALFAFMGGMILCMATIVRAQWTDNERLPFPLAGVFNSLIEQPEEKKLLNPLLSSRLFWIAFAAVFFLHGTNALHGFFPRYVPEIPRGFDFNNVIESPPLSLTEWYFKRASLYFSVIGLTFFLQSAVSFSLWFFVVLVQIVAMIFGSYEAQFTGGMRSDESFGGVSVFALSILWVGRKHWLLVLRQMLRGARQDEPASRYISYPIAGWGMLICLTGLAGCLVAAGCTMIGAATISALLLMFFLVAARIVAETGIPFMQFSASLSRFWTTLAPFGLRTTDQTFFYSGFLHGSLIADMRESAAVFTGQALRVADTGAYDGERGSRRTWPLVACLVVALSSGFIVSGASMLYCEYAYATSLDRNNNGAPINPYVMGGTGEPKGHILEPTSLYAREGGTGTNDKHSSITHVGIGAALTGFLAFMRLRFTAWPLHPVGFLLCFSYPMMMIWFSVFVGWLCKFLTVRFGGIELYRTLRPLFLGMIIGEAGAVAFWLVVNLACVQLGIDYYSTRILPG